MALTGRIATRSEERVTPLELFFDLVFVFAITQVTSLVSREPTWQGLGKGVLVLVLLWWAWAAYAWLTSTVDPEEGIVRLAMFGAMAAMLVASLSVPGAFGDDALVFAAAYTVVRIAHLGLYALAGRGDPELLHAVATIAPTSLASSALLFGAAALDARRRRPSGSRPWRSTSSAPSSAGAAAGTWRRGISPSVTA